MAGSMSQGDLVADLKASLQDAAEVFTAANDADFKRHLSVAAMDLGRFRGRTLLGSLTLVADKYDYPAPANFLRFKSSLWGISQAPAPWEKTWPGRLPDVHFMYAANGSGELHFMPPPTAEQISLLKAEYKYYYFAGHVIGEAANNTTVRAVDRGLLILRAQVETLRELAMRNIKKPVALRDGISNAPRNGTPTALYETFLKEFERAAA